MEMLEVDTLVASSFTSVFNIQVVMATGAHGQNGQKDELENGIKFKNTKDKK